MAAIILCSVHDAYCFLRPQTVENILSFDSFIILFSLIILVAKERIEGRMGLEALIRNCWSKLLIFFQPFPGTMLMTPERRRAIWAIYGEGFLMLVE